MSRRKDSIDRDSLREKLLAIAEALVVQGGAEALTARALALHLGYSVGHVYNLVQDLDALICILNGRTLDRLRGSLQKSAARHKGPARLYALAEAYLAFCAEHPHLWTLVLTHAAGKKGPLPEEYAAKVGALPALVKSEIKKLFPQRSAELIRQDVALLWSALQGISALETSGRLALIQSPPASRLAQHLIGIWLSADPRSGKG